MPQPTSESSNPTPPNRREDDALLPRLQAGDPAAFEQLVRDHAGRMLAVAKRFLRSESDASDAVQDAFLSAFKAIGSFGGTASLGTWLHSIVVRASLMKLRTRRRRPEQAIEDLLPQYTADGHRVQPGGGWVPAVDQLAELEESRSIVRRCIEQLPSQYCTVLLLRDIEEYDTEETAQLLGINANAVKTRLHRARQALRTLLNPYFGETAAAGGPAGP
ncbi:RNA polymerase sigma factor [Humisphaera borealis]|uniref:Sigma-70 family RNA polymerase sigma factor n=1 Tax=Humisphaera borealis TaxID=2807512 RepID=A0A7M2WWG4_9BACT|nr:sigma-70 family RNA polymerase sigma factor [Humisphaera borealis]QOV89542.1 sigma-70 family RNA polymerase sigma factor [Humisphaera borealis]